MGIAQQKDASEYFTRALISQTPPDPTAFLAKVRQHERSLCGGTELYAVGEPAAAALLDAADTAQQGHFRWLLQLCHDALQRIIDNPNEPIDGVTPALLHLTELLLRHLLRLSEGRSVVLVNVLEAGGHDHAGSSSGNLAATATATTTDLLKDDAAALLCRAAFTFLFQVPLSSTNVQVYLEVLRLLLTMTSSALHHGTDFREDTMDLFTELMMSSPQLPDGLEALLRLTVKWGKSNLDGQAPLLYHEGRQPSMRNFFQLFSGGGSSGEGGSGDGGADGRGASSGLRVPYVLEVETSVGPVTVTAAASPGDTDVNTSSPSATAAGTSNSATAAPATAPAATKAAMVSVQLKNPASVIVSSSSCWEQVGRHAAALLCVLVVHQKGGGRNPALEYICAMRDGAPVSFAALLMAIRRRLPRYPELSILLYVLLHDHQEFLHAVLTTDAALLVSTIQQLLEVTYKACRDSSRPAPVIAASIGKEGSAAGATSADEDVLQDAVLGRLVYHLRIFSYPFINFMSSTVLLLISQDCVVNRLLCSTPCLPGHLLERYDSNAPVGALAIVVLTLGITKGFNERNEALIAVFAPCMVNIAPFVRDIDPYTAQRVSGLLTLVLKKIHRAAALLRSSNAAAVAAAEREASEKVDGTSQAGSDHAAAAGAVASAEETRALEEILAMYVRQLRTVVEAVEALLRGPNRGNEHLVYELLYARNRLIDEVDTAVAAQLPYAGPTKQLLVNLVEMVKNCEADIASSDHAQSTQEIIAILRRGQRQGVSGGGGESVEGKEKAGEASSNHHHHSGSGGSGGGLASAAGTGGGNSDAHNGAGNGAAGVPGPDVAGTEAVSLDLVYSYEESPHSYDFLGPFVWSILLSMARSPGGALWCRHSSELALFPL